MEWLIGVTFFTGYIAVALWLTNSIGNDLYDLGYSDRKGILTNIWERVIKGGKY